MKVYVLTNPPGVGIGHPLGVYTTLQLAEQAATAFGRECRIQEIAVDEPADYAACETHYPPGESAG